MKTRDESRRLYLKVAELADERHRWEAMRDLARSDLYYLLTWVLGRRDAENDWCYERCREVQASPDGHLDLWARDHYKALWVNTLVPTPAGWRFHGDLDADDEVFGPDGKPARVVARTKVFRDADCYRLTFCDGAELVASSDHLWTVDVPSRARVAGNVREKWKTITVSTRELAEHVSLARERSSRRYPTIPVSAPVQRPEADLPLDPYVLGAWLGDGASGGVRVTAGLSDADEMMALLQETGVKVAMTSHSNAASLRLGTGVRGDRTSSDVAGALSSLGIYREKRIPRLYMEASERQRWALLQGLMDTDGSCHGGHAQCIFCSANEALALDALNLCLSLGIKATMAERSSEYRGAPRAFWQVQFRGYRSKPPFRMTRKAERCASDGHRPPSRRVVSVERVPSVPCSCIQVDREDGLYLVGQNHIATHNSTIVSVALSIQEILRDPEVTIGVFSFSAAAAQGIVAQIKREFDSRAPLRWLFPDIIWERPSRDAPSWSVQGGITVRRRTNPRECTVEGHSFMEGAPVGKHFSLCLYDDVVTMDSVATPEMITKTTKRWELSIPLGRKDARRRYVGTRYHYQDTYQTMIEREAAVPRIHPAEDDLGNPAFLSREQLDEKRRSMGPTSYASQMLLSPNVDSTAGFLEEWLRYWDNEPSRATMNVYIVVDSANERKRTSDWTVMWVIGLGADHNYYVLDIVRDRLSLRERGRKLIELHRKWSPDYRNKVNGVGYEKYGKDADIETIEQLQDKENYRFDITPLGGSLAKRDRINRLEPVFAAGRVYLPRRLMYTQYDGLLVDLVHHFVHMEYRPYPAIQYDDMLDALARILDDEMMVIWPRPTRPKRDIYDEVEPAGSNSWMAG